ncbi:SCO3374 family protein [Streptomyces sp. Caat 7-52]|uniref:SCO3374 family protein n=1 Tax=Streptomyces sp. Caat 7-52 TaxID=2949637 RepID=UPI002034B06A|nr:SCO3374 family protein [Streptomyces sp. Caat 7-52]
MNSTVPLPRRPHDPGGPAAGDPGTGDHSAAGSSAAPDARARHWYENDLGWPTVPGRPLRLLTGVRFDVLDVPAEAGAQALRHLAPNSPVILRGDRMELLVAPGSAEELPGLLDWLEWGTVPLDLRAVGPGGTLEAPPPPADVSAVRPGRVPTGSVWPGSVPPGYVPPGSVASGSVASGSVRAGSPRAESARAVSARGAVSVQGAVAAVWLRPPGPGGEAEASLPAMPAMPAGSCAGREGSAPDLVRVVDTVATQCHRVRLRRPRAGHPTDRRNQPLAFS